MKILLLGANGQVGWELQRALSTLGEVIACDRTTADLENLPQLEQTVLQHNPNIIVNAAAYTAVDKAESDKQTAACINTNAVEKLASLSKQLDALLVHYSTDYVFDGTKTSAYSETDNTNPLSVYGETKLQGEQAIINSDCKHLIFRTSWVYAARGANFIKTILRLARARNKLSIVADQHGAPTGAALIADTTLLCLHSILSQSTDNENLYGLYHLTAKGNVSWHEFAQHIVLKADDNNIPLTIKADNIKPISTAEYPLPATRPCNSRLDTSKLENVFNIKLPDWKQGVNHVLDEVFETIKHSNT